MMMMTMDRSEVMQGGLEVVCSRLDCVSACASQIVFLSHNCYNGPVPSLEHR